eukprot:9634508-Alexandrium_andersonii.AAC.1
MCIRDSSCSLCPRQGPVPLAPPRFLSPPVSPGVRFPTGLHGRRLAPSGFPYPAAIAANTMTLACGWAPLLTLSAAAALARALLGAVVERAKSPWVPAGVGADR